MFFLNILSKVFKNYLSSEFFKFLNDHTHRKLYNRIANIASTITISKFSGYYSEKNPILLRKFRYNIVDAIFKIISRNFCDFFYGCTKRIKSGFRFLFLFILSGNKYCTHVILSSRNINKN
jgi:hypothetical protein